MRLSHTSRRPATVTVIVIAFLALLAVVALTFALYGMREADESKVFRDNHNGGQTGSRFVTRGSSTTEQPPEPEVIANAALGAMIYGTPGDSSGMYSALRHQEIARTIYGFDPNNPFGATQPYNGVGRVPPGVIFGSLPPTLQPPSTTVNWSRIPGNLLYSSDHNYVYDPSTNNPPFNPLTYRYYARNANYTYQDLNNLYLAAIDPRSGQVTVPSYHRPWNITGALPPNSEAGPTQVVVDPNNDWTNPQGRLLMLRPRPVEHQYAPGVSDWRYPEPDGFGGYGDVKNIVGGAGGNDSLWMDLDLPVATWQGKQYKPMVAFCILDLDGRVNVNVAGNYYFDLSNPFLSQPHSSTQGIGPWEVNLEKIIPQTPWPGPGPKPASWGSENEAQTLVLGEFSGTLTSHHRFGEHPALGRVPRKVYTSQSTTIPYPTMLVNMPDPGSGAYHYAAVDYDGRGGVGRYSDYSSGHETAFTWGPPYQGTGAMGDPPPGRPHQNSRYKNGIYLPPIMEERMNHPSMLNPYLVRSRRTINLNPAGARDLPNHVYDVAEMKHLNATYNYGRYTSSDSELARLAPKTLGRDYYFSGQFNPRFAMTVISNDIDIPGSTPWLSSPQQLTLNGYQAPQLPSHPTGATPQTVDYNAIIPPTGGEDFDPNSYRAKLTTQLGPIDIDRRLTDYRGDASAPYSENNFDPGKEPRARMDRQALAKDIFDRLRFVSTGVLPSTLPVPGEPSYNGLRWLAQLAVNIVDYIDNDDYMTPFNWNPTGLGAQPPSDAMGAGQDSAKQGWVFGFERPRLVINEVYARVENDPTDPGPLADPPTPAILPYVAKFWLELHNPLTPANAAELGLQSDGGAALLFNQQTGFSVYKISIVSQQAQAQLDALDNPLGNVVNLGQQKELASTSFTAPNADMTHDRVSPNQLDLNNTGYPARPQNVMGAAPPFFLVASEQHLPDDTPNNDLRANRVDRNFQYNVPLYDPADNNASVNERAARILLRRLANPHMAPGQFNPYVTVDYFRMDRLMMNNAISVDNKGNIPKGKGKGGGLLRQQIVFSQNRAYGRRQPLVAPNFTEPGQINPPVVPPSADLNPYMQRPDTAADGTVLAGVNGVSGEYIMHTFARHNGKGDTWPNPPAIGDTLDLPFQPLAHLDRILLSPAELLHVCATPPYKFGHAFQAVGAPAPRWKHTANWLDEGVVAGTPGLNLWRALEFLKKPTWYDGLGMGGRVPGKININTIPRNSPEAFIAACDAQPGNRFTENTDVARAWRTLITNPVTGRTPTNGFTQNDRPIWGLANMVEPPGPAPKDRSRTIAAANGMYDPLADESFTSGAGGRAGSLQKFEMMSKVFNNFTTRSNVFAVYTTIGYFEVKNAGPFNETNRPILGKEIGIDEGKVERHKFFAIVDRTNLSIELPTVPGQTVVRQGPAPVFLSYQPNTVPPIPGPPPGGNNSAIYPDAIYQGEPAPGMPIELRVPATGVDANGHLVGHYDGTYWTMQPATPNRSTWLLIDIGERQELVQIPAASAMIPQPVRMDPTDPTQKSGIITVFVMKPHYRNAIIRIVNPDPTLPGAVPSSGMPVIPVPSTMPGNPGPQPGFNYKSQRYAPVVKYVEQLK